MTAATGLMSSGISFRLPQLAWAGSSADELRFRQTLRRTLAVSACGALLMGLMPVKPMPKTALDLVALPTARWVAPPEAPKPVVKPQLPTAASPQAAALQPPVRPLAPAPATAATAAPKPASPEARAGQVAQARNPKPDRPAGEDLNAMRQRASGVGLLAAKDQISALHAAPLAAQLNSAIEPGPGIGQGSGPGVGAGTEAGLPARALIAANASAGSGGLQTAAYSRHSGGGGLAGRATTLVEGTAGGGGGGGPGGGQGGGTGLGSGGTGSGTGAAGAGKGGSVQRGGGAKAGRSIEDIRLVFERHKGAIYALYQRALREDASLQGKVVLELKIAPSGEVSGLRVVSSDLKAPELESKLLARVRQFDFGAKEVDPMVVTWPVDFLPA